MNRKRFAGLITIVVLVSISVMIMVRRETFGEFCQLFFPVALTPLEPMPAYLSVYPKPAQHVSLSTKSGRYVLETSHGQWMVLRWYPGLTCVLLDPSEFLQPGDFWGIANIDEFVSLELNGEKAKVAYRQADYEGLEIWEDGELVAKTGGPYGICWEGSKQKGYIRAKLNLKSYSYSWWYKNVK